MSVCRWVCICVSTSVHKRPYGCMFVCLCACMHVPFSACQCANGPRPQYPKFMPFNYSSSIQHVHRYLPHLRTRVEASDPRSRVSAWEECSNVISSPRYCSLIICWAPVGQCEGWRQRGQKAAPLLQSSDHLDSPVVRCLHCEQWMPARRVGDPEWWGTVGCGTPCLSKRRRRTVSLATWLLCFILFHYSDAVIL